MNSTPISTNHHIPILKVLPPTYNTRNHNLITTIQKKIELMPINKILKINKFEKLIPYNLWFRNEFYKIANCCQNNQYMRIRYYKTSMLTPIIRSKDNETDVTQIKSFLPILSLYQPFYPETFYAIWEFLQMKHVNITSKHFLNISRKERLGGIESIIFYHEKYQQTYQYNTYHSWLAGEEKYNQFNFNYAISVPNINFLAQAYKIEFISSSKQLRTYDFINIDTIHIFENIFQWDNEELDLQSILFYFITALEHLAPNGSLLLRLNVICANSWCIIFDIANVFFREYTFFRPSTLNPLNSEVYLFLDKYNGQYASTLYYVFLRNLYKNQVYNIMNLNCPANHKNPIYCKYISAVHNWEAKLTDIMNTNMDVDYDLSHITKWHEVHDLKQIKDVIDTTGDRDAVDSYVLKSSETKFMIKPVAPTILYSIPFYKQMIMKRSELNYYKRVMDTKPSKIFDCTRYKKTSGDMLTWEELSDFMNPYKSLRNILKSKYGAETVTNAWIKMYELLNMFPNLIESKQTIKTFHLCEAPGAFISALNHYLDNKSQKLDWYAQTLRPIITDTDGTNTALDDHFGLIQRYPNRWIFGDPMGDVSGDITHSAIIRYYSLNMRGIDFMTADAGLMSNPNELNEQEAYLGKINMGQILCILSCLSIGKSAIFKTFLPMTEPLTISMMYLVTLVFDSVTITKPSTSHRNNSEIYVILMGYRGVSMPMLDILYKLLDDVKITSKTLLMHQIDKLFFKSYMKINEYFVNQQIKTLCTSYYYYYHLNELEYFQKKNIGCVKKWLESNPISVLRNYLL